MTKFYTLLAAVAVLFTASNAFAFDWSPCKAEMEKFKCSGDDEAVYQCLLKHDVDLSKNCDNGAHTKYEKEKGIAK
jgi:hypothetical protein